MAEVVDLKASQIIHAPVNTTTVITEGQIVECGSDLANAGDGVQSITAAAGVVDITGLTIPFGVVLGDNSVNKTYNTDGSIDTGTGMTSVTGLETQAGQVARESFGQEGMWSKGDKQVFVQVAMIDATTRIKVHCYNGAFGTAPTLLTATAGSATGLGCTTNAIDFTPIADYQTFYCRTGKNAGLYRISETTSTTVHTFQIPFSYDIEVGDTFVAIPGRFGVARIQLDALASYQDTSVDPAVAGDYYQAIVEHIDLREAGKEHIVFRFGSAHFSSERAVHA